MGNAATLSCQYDLDNVSFLLGEWLTVRDNLLIELVYRQVYIPLDGISRVKNFTALSLKKRRLQELS